MASFDAGVAEAVNGSAEAGDDVPQSVLDHIADTFSNADATELEGPGEETVSAPAPSPREVTRREAVKQEEKDELDQEGLEGSSTEEAGEKEVAEGGAEEQTDEGLSAEAAAEPVSPLDPNLRFVAQHYGWEDKDIDALYEANPQLAEKTFGNFLNAFTVMSRQSGLLPAQAQQQTPPAAQVAKAPSSKIDQIIGNLKEFNELNGEPLGDFVKALNDELVVPFRQLQAELAVAKQQAVAAEAVTTTDSLAGKFPDVYGTGDKLNLVHQTNRQNLYTVADQLRAGAFQQGKEMSVKDALNRAHLIVTADRQVQSGRKQVQEQVQRRAKTITARPTQRVKPGSAGVAKGEGAAMEAYLRRATELGMDVGE